MMSPLLRQARTTLQAQIIPAKKKEARVSPNAACPAAEQEGQRFVDASSVVGDDIDIIELVVQSENNTKFDTLCPADVTEEKYPCKPKFSVVLTL